MAEGNPYKDAASVSTINLATIPLGIHTIKIGFVNNVTFYGIELIAQDVGSTARKNHVNIPAQTVVSYGKKFSVGSDTITNAVHKHHNPFAFKTDGSTAWAVAAHNGTSWPVGTLASHNIDTTTSLGLESWKHSSNYYRPYNGGRVVIWVDSTGAIKTSVNVMPPNARSIANSASVTNATAKANASIANNTFYPTFQAGQPEHSQSEIAKEFHWREFGNGAGNQGSDGNSLVSDFSMLDGVDDVAYVMEDGVTAMAGNDVRKEAGALPDVQQGGDHNLGPVTTDDFYTITFMGTGVSATNNQNATSGISYIDICDNLPYGTHTLKVIRLASQRSSTLIDDVAVRNDIDDGYWDYGHLGTVTFHQPKRPPIPENACVLADYMLMADFTPQTAEGIWKISKGVRKVACSRDIFCSGSENHGLGGAGSLESAQGMNMSIAGTASSGTTSKAHLPAFGTNYVWGCRNYDVRSNLYVGTTDKDSVAIHDSGGTDGSYAHLPIDHLELGVHKFGCHAANGQNGLFFDCAIVSPTHTSSPYQPFEAPFL